MPSSIEFESHVRKALYVGLHLTVDGDCYTLMRAGKLLLTSTRWRLIRGRISHYEKLFGKEEHW